MSVLGLDEVAKRIKKDKLIENLGARDLKNPEGVGIDLRLGELHQIVKGRAFIDADIDEVNQGARKGVETKLIAQFNPDLPPEKQERIELQPGEYYLAVTLEKVNLPENLFGQFFPRTSLFRAGVLFLPGKADPGYSGPLTFGLKVLDKFPFKIQMGARFSNIVFVEITGKAVKYRGQHQGGRVSHSKVETQV